MNLEERIIQWFKILLGVLSVSAILWFLYGIREAVRAR